MNSQYHLLNLKDLAKISSLRFPLLALACMIFSISCKKLTEVAPPTTLIAANNVYNSDATAIAVVTTIYADNSGASLGSPGFLTSLSSFGGLSADELTLLAGSTNAIQLAYYRNSLSASSAASNYGSDYWSNFYNYIFKCNDAIQGLNASSGLTPAVKQQLLGEAKFMRAYFYFYLVNLYGDVPLALTTDYKVNSNLPRTPKKQVYQQIEADLLDAQRLLSAQYLDASLLKSSADRLRPTQWAATALLARAYLYNGALTGDASNYSNAEQQAATVIDNSGGLFGLSSLSAAFQRASLGNKEAIWQLQPVTTNITNTQDGYFFIPDPILGPANSNFTGYLNAALLNSFENGDARKTNWINSVTVSGTTYYYPFKYKISPVNSISPPVTEHTMMLRLAEQYLIRAEARAQQGNVTGAQADLNVIRTRSGLPNTTASDKATVLSAILHERQVELFTEMGHRWFDLKRTGNIDAVMGTGGACAAKGGTWNTNQQWYPLPVTDLQLDPNLNQNAGY